MIRILIADDHPIFRAGIRQLLSITSDIEIIAEAESGQDVIAKVAKYECDVVVLDISMPGMGGLEALKLLKSLKPKLRILILSAHREEEYAVRAIKAGAAGYVRKISTPEELIIAIRQVFQGRKYITPSLAEELASAMTIEKKLPHEALSDREYQVLRLIVKGLSIKELAEELSLSPSTVATFRARILHKMNMKTNIELARYGIDNELFD